MQQYDPWLCCHTIPIPTQFVWMRNNITNNNNVTLSQYLTAVVTAVRIKIGRRCDLIETICARHKNNTTTTSTATAAVSCGDTRLQGGSRNSTLITLGGSEAKRRTEIFVVQPKQSGNKALSSVRTTPPSGVFLFESSSILF